MVSVCMSFVMRRNFIRYPYRKYTLAKLIVASEINGEELVHTILEKDIVDHDFCE